MGKNLSKQFLNVASTIFLSATFLAACTSTDKVDSAKSAQEKEAVSALIVEKKAFEENRYLSKDEVNAVTQSFDKIAETSNPEDAKKLRAMSDAVKTYRTKLEEFKSLGGAKVETLKSPADLETRLKMIGVLINMSSKVKETCVDLKEGPSAIRTLDLEHQMLEKIRDQLSFYKAHYGQWQIQKNGTVLFTISPAELTQFNKLAKDINVLGTQQMVIMKQNTEERLNKLNRAH